VTNKKLKSLILSPPLYVFVQDQLHGTCTGITIIEPNGQQFRRRTGYSAFLCSETRMENLNKTEIFPEFFLRMRKDVYMNWKEIALKANGEGDQDKVNEFLELYHPELI